MVDLAPLVAQALDILGVTEPPETYAALLRSSISSAPISQHGASLTLQKVLDRTPTPEARAQFTALHESLRGRGVRELDRFTLFLKLVGEEPSIASMLRKAGQADVSGTKSTEAAAAAAAAGAAPARPAAAVSIADANWQLTRPYLCGTYLLPDSHEVGTDMPPQRAAAMLAALPVAQQEEMLVADVLCVLCGVEGTFLRASVTGGAGGQQQRLAVLAAGALPRASFGLPQPAIGESQMLRADASLLAVVSRLAPLGEQYLLLWHWSHAKASQLSSGLVVHAFAGALRQCLKEHLVMVAQLQSQHRARGLSLQQLWYFLQPAKRALATLHDLLQAMLCGDRTGGDKGAAGAPCAGGALLRLLHERRRALVGEPEGAALLDFLLRRAAAPFFEMLQGWIYRGQCRGVPEEARGAPSASARLADPYAEFMVHEERGVSRDELRRDFNCAYWQRRFVLAPERVPAFLAPHAQLILDTGKHLHVVRECGRALHNPDDPIAYTADERALSASLGAAWRWASAALLQLLMGEQKLMGRLASIKHYFLLDQGDFFVHFLDSAEEELVKPVAHISRGRLHSKLELSLRQAAGTDPFNGSLSCDLLPYNLTKQLLRIINTSRGPAGVPTPQSAEKTPGLDAFTFDYHVDWPLSLVLSKHALIKYQLIFRHLFHCKHVERQLSASWLSQQATKGLAAMASFSASYGLRQRMLHFLQNLEYYMMFEVLEPNFHVLQQRRARASTRLGAAGKLDELIAQHNGFLDKCLKECMLRDAVLLKLLAKLLTVCVIFADHTRLVMQDVAKVLAATSLAPHGAARRTQLRQRSAQVERTIAECRYNASVQKLGAKFDEEMTELLAELRKQAHKEWNLAHLSSRLDYNNFWQHVRSQSVAVARPVGKR